MRLNGMIVKEDDCWDLRRREEQKLERKEKSIIYICICTCV
jgi:hypothetical protein